MGLGLSDACLLTSDVPVVILNGHDDENQLLSVSYWDILLPLDSYRLPLLPSRFAQDDPRKRRDHRFKLDGGLGIAVNMVLYDAADMHVFRHPATIQSARCERWVALASRRRGPAKNDAGGIVLHGGLGVLEEYQSYLRDAAGW